MKNKILKLSLSILLIFAVLFTLTACGDEDDEKSSKKGSVDTSSAESVIEAFVDAVNDQDASAVCDLIDFDALEKTFGDEINKKDFKAGLKDFFKEYDDLEVEVSKIKHLKKDSDMLDSLLEVYDSYDEYIEEIEDEYDIEGATIYTAKVELSEDYEDFIDDLSDTGRDVIYMTEVDDEFKIVYTRLAVTLYSEYYYSDNDNDDDDDDDIPSEEAVKFNKDYEDYEGTQTGKAVNEMLDKVIDTNKKNVDDHIIYVSYYDEDGIIDVFMTTEKSEIDDLKDKIATSHKYKVELDEDYEGFIRYIDITY